MEMEKPESEACMHLNLTIYIIYIMQTQYFCSLQRSQ